MGAYKFRVLLDSTKKEEIFRDIVIDKTASFERFYQAIKEGFAFTSEQMASFYMSNDEWDKGDEITLMDMSFGDEENTMIMSETLLENQIIEADQKIILVHDFLNMWIFLIELLNELDINVQTPYVSLAVGQSPDENEKRADLVMESDFVGDEDFEEDEFGDFDSFDEDDFSDGFESYDESDY